MKPHIAAFPWVASHSYPHLPNCRKVSVMGSKYLQENKFQGQLNQTVFKDFDGNQSWLCQAFINNIVWHNLTDFTKIALHIQSLDLVYYSLFTKHTQYLQII